MEVGKEPVPPRPSSRLDPLPACNSAECLGNAPARLCHALALGSKGVWGSREGCPSPGTASWGELSSHATPRDWIHHLGPEQSHNNQAE